MNLSRSSRLFFSLLTGVLLSLPWLGFPGWVLFFAWLPLFYLNEFLNAEKHRFRSIVFWGHSWFAFLTWNVITTWWVMHATVMGAFLAIFLNSLLMSVVFWLAHIIFRRLGRRMGYLAFVSFWITFEYLHFHWEIEWPWLTLGNGFANNVGMIQWYEFTGALGGSLWVLVLSVLLTGFLKKVLELPLYRAMRAAWMPLALLALPWAWSLYRFYTYEEVEQAREVVIVQPNIDPYDESHDAQDANDNLLRFVGLASKHITPETDYIVGPETVFEQHWDVDRLNEYPMFMRLQQLNWINSRSSLIIGASTYKIFREGETLTSTARLSRDGLRYDVYNSALFSCYSGNYQVYHKSILVSGVEKMPFRKYLKFLEHFIIDLGGTTGSLGRMEEPQNFTTPDSIRLAPVICYESVFGGYLAKFVAKGAQLICIITNDGWWKNTPGYRQHFSFARLRAVETRRTIVRSANTGISGIINQRGEIEQKSKWWEEAVITATVNLNDKLTFYVRNGDYIARGLSFVSVLLLLYLLANSMVKHKKNPHQF